VDFSKFNDTIDIEYPYDKNYKLTNWEKLKHLMKRIVSLKKRRIETKDFNLDMR